MGRAHRIVPKLSCLSLVGLVAGCTPTTIDPPDRTPTPDTGWGEQDAGWTLAASTACEAPVPLAWRDASDELRAQPWPDVRANPGLGLIRHPEGSFEVLTTCPPNLVLGYGSDGTARARGFTTPPSQLRVVDLDADGFEDVVLFGDGVEVVWSWGRPEEWKQTLLPPQEDFVVTDLEVTDIDGDGSLELLLLRQGREGLPLLQGPIGLLDNTDSGWQPSIISDSAESGAPFDLSAWDVDQDGDLDLYVCMDRGPDVIPNRAFLNEGGTFHPVDDWRGSGVALNCMTTGVGDVDRDGAFDLLLGGVERRYLLVDTPDGFVDEAQARGLAAFEPAQMVWGAQVADLYNDGWADLLTATGDFSVEDPLLFPVLAAVQDGGGGFDELGADWGLPQATGTRGVLARDLNGDGVLDLVFSDQLRQPWLFLSEGCTAASWLDVEAPNGSRVVVHADGETWTALVAGAPGVFASSSPSAHIGLGDHETVDGIELFVPGEGRQLLPGPIEARRVLRWSPDG